MNYNSLIKFVEMFYFSHKSQVDWMNLIDVKFFFFYI